MPAYVTGSGGSGIRYAPHGVPSFYFYGNNLARSVTFNGRLQMTGFVEDLGNSTANQFLNVGLNWYPQNGAASANSGNLQWAAYYNGGAAANNGGINYSSFLTFSQTYTYDAVNRLSSVVDNNPNCTTAASAANTVCYSRSFGYDNFGNIYISGAAGIAAAGNAPQASGLYNGNNQLTSGSYDAAGNQTSVNGNTVGYDAESRQISVAGAGVNESYLYDGDGRRVEKAAGGTAQTVFVYDALGRLAAEYSASAYTTPCVTCYLSPDHLGTTRMVTSQDAMVVARHDYLPFGEEIGANVAGRNSQWGPGNDSVNQKFTGKERDSESGLDYFGARYYGSALGRFTSPDPHTGTQMHLINPQRWNMYAYGLNNPLFYTDPFGKDAIAVGLTNEVPVFGHAGIISVHKDGTATYADYGPVSGGLPWDEGHTVLQDLPKVSFDSDGTPTQASFDVLAAAAGKIKGQNPDSIKMSFFKTSEADTAALDSWLFQQYKRKRQCFN